MTTPSKKLRLRRGRELIDAMREYQNAWDRYRQVLCEGLGINRTDARCLDMLELHGEQTAGELASRIGISSGAMTGVLDRLEKRGYARRIHDTNDRRRIQVAITEKAYADTARYWGPPAKRLDQAISTLNDDELALLARFNRETAGALFPRAEDTGAES